MNEEFVLTNQHLIILNAINLLKEKGYQTTSKGLFNILTGLHLDDIAKEFECFGHYSKLSQRPFASKIRMLERYGYLKYRYSKELNDYLLVLTNLGESKIKQIAWHKHEQKMNDILPIEE